MDIADITRLKDAFLRCFTDNPVNWLKWIIILAVFIACYVAIIKFKIGDNILNRWERKRDKAKAMGHVIKAKLISSSISGDAPNYTSYGKYEYSLNEKTKRYTAYFNYKNPPRIVYLYYLKNPNRVFCCDEYHVRPISGFIMALIIFSPFIICALLILLLRVDISGFQ